MSDRGREKHLTSPDGDKKKRGSLFRRPSLSRKKTKEENSANRRAKSRDRATDNHSDYAAQETTDVKKKSSSLPRDSKSPFGRHAGKLKKEKDRKPLDLESKTTFGLPLDEVVKRAGCYNIELPEVVLNTIGEIESRGLQTEDIYKTLAPKSEVDSILTSFHRLEEIDISAVDIHTVAAVLKGFINSLPGSVFDCIHDRLEECVKNMDTFVTKSNKLFETPLFPRHNLHICSWLFVHLANISANADKNKMTEEALAAIWCPILNITKDLFGALIHYSTQFFGTVSLERGRSILRWKDSSAELKIPTDASEEWIEEEINNQENALGKLHNLDKTDKYSEERMWEVQRIKTALKRKQKQLKKQREEIQQKEQEELDALIKEEQHAIVEKEELLRMQHELRLRLDDEKKRVELLRSKLPTVETKSKALANDVDEDQLNAILDELVKENARLESENSELVSRINEERDSLLTARIDHRITSEARQS